MRTRFFLFALTLVAASAVSCALLDRLMPPVALPARSAVDRAVVRLPSPDSFNPNEVEITDPDRVGRVLAFLGSRNSGWYGTWHTEASADLSVRLERDGQLLLVVRVGETWISAQGYGPSGPDHNRYRDLSEKDRAELLAVLGLPADTPSHR
jgi:hypothetical protein